MSKEQPFQQTEKEAIHLKEAEIADNCIDEALSAAGARAAANEVGLVGTVLGGVYEVESLIGSGGMSTVYKVKHLVLDRCMAVKVVRRERIQDAGAVRRFIQEAKASSTLSHPNIVPAREFGIDQNGNPFLVMDFVEGRSLANIIEQDGKLEPRRAVNLIGQICSGLAHAHERGVIHRDIKPGNILVKTAPDGTETAMLSDFGIAKVTTDQEGLNLTQTGDVFGTPLYMSPEQCSGKKLDARSDIYSLGCVLYEALCGRTPYEGVNVLDTMMKHINAEGPEFEKAFPSALRSPLARAMEPTPEKRFSNVEEFQVAIESAGGGGRQFERPRLKKKERNLLVNVILVIFLLAAVSLIYCKSVANNTRNQISSAAYTWPQADFKTAKHSFDTIFKNIENCPASNYEKWSMYRELGLLSKVVARETDQISYADAEKCLEKSLSLSDNERDRATIIRSLADCARLRKDFEKSEKLYDTAVQSRRKEAGPKQELLIHALYGQAVNFLDQNKLGQARTSLAEALSISETNHDRVEQPKLLFALGRLEQKDGNLERAHEYFARTFETEKKTSTAIGRIGMLSLLSDASVLQKLGRTEDAQKVQEIIENISTDAADN